MPSQIKQHIALAPYTTLGVGGSADFFAEVGTRVELAEVLAWAEVQGLPVHILGGGSNVLVPDEGVRGVVVRPVLGGVTFEEAGEEILVRAGAGVVFDCLIADLIEKGIWGLENLSGIPGSVGAVPIQNVGAYGVEAKDVVQGVIVYNLEQHTVEELSADACAFAYRDSIFKSQAGKKYIILEVTFRLTKTAHPQLAYRDLAVVFGSEGSPALAAIRKAVLDIRSRKFPDWTKVGTAGSFFKNPIVSKEAYAALQAEYPELPGYVTGEGRVKLALGWILEHVCALKGYREGTVGLYEKQALVLVCEKGAPSAQVEMFAQKITDTVFEKTGIAIEREVSSLT